MEILKICPHEQLLIKYYLIKQLILLKFRYDGYQRILTSMVYKCFDKKLSGGGIKNKIMSKQEFAKEFLKPII